MLRRECLRLALLTAVGCSDMPAPIGFGLRRGTGTVVCLVTFPTAAANLPQSTGVTITGTIGAPGTVTVSVGGSSGAATVMGLDWSYSYTPSSTDYGAQTINAAITATGSGALGYALPISVNITEPTVLALANGMVGRWDIDGANSQADAGAVTAITDISGAGGNYGGGSGFTFRTSRWNTDFAPNKHAINCQTGNSMFAASASLIAAFNGVNHPHTVFTVYQDLSAGTAITWSAENTYPNVQTKRKVNQVSRYTLASTTDFTFTGIATQGLQISCFERAASTISLHTNGVADAANPLACASAQNFACTKLSLGEQDGSAITPMLIREQIVFNRVLTADEKAAVTQRLSYKHGLDWCQAIGSGIGTSGKDVVVIPLVGQSNNVGQGTVAYARVCDDVYVLDWDFAVRTVPKGDPVSVCPQANSLPPSITRVGIGNYDAWGALADRLKADPQFANKILLFVPVAVGGWTSALATAGTGTTPRDITTGYGNTWHKITYALRAKNAKLGPAIVWQGESNVDTLAHATTGWSTDWAAFCTAFDSDFAGKFLKSLHYVFVVPPPTVPVTFDATNWAALRTTIHAIPSTITNSQTVDAYDGLFTDSTFLHLQTGVVTPSPTGLRGTGDAVAGVILAAS